VPKGTARAVRPNGAGVSVPKHDPERGGFFVLFLLLAVVPFALLGFGPGAGVAQEQQGGVSITGEGQAGFPAPGGPDGKPGCEFLVDAVQDDTGPHGSFTCHLPSEAGPLWLPFASIEATVTAVEAPSEEEATIEGLALVELTDGEILEDVPALIGVHAGGPGTGELRIFLEGVLDGESGDETPGDGNYSLLAQDVTEGSIDINLGDPSPSPSPSPSETPGPSPSPTPTSTVTPSPSPSPSPTSTAPPPPGPPGPPNPVPPGIPPGTPIDEGPFFVGGSQSTARLMAILAGLSPDGIPRLNDILAVVGPFPVAGLAWWQDDWHAPRCCPFPHLHQGLDIFAPRGTPVVAAIDGYVTQKVDGPVSGLAVEIADAGNTQYYYAHLSAFASGVDVGTPVRVGQVVGYVGNTGNAHQTSPHLHFEIQPNGVPVPPMPIVNGWLRLSEQRAISLFERTTGRNPLDPATLRSWIKKALALTGRNSAQEVADESAVQPSGSRPAASEDPHPAGPLVAFAGGALLILIVIPAVMVGVKDARKGWWQAGGGVAREAVRTPAASSPEGETPTREDRTPGGARQRPAAR
jgi:peptidase M23-like protein